MSVRELRGSAGSAHRTSRDEQRWRAARRRIRETLAIRRAEAAAGGRDAGPVPADQETG